MAKVFISYSRKDIEFTKRLTGELQKSDLDFWVDWEGIPPTVDWWREIEKGIEEADAFIFLISPDSAASKICGQEIDCAVKNSKRIIPLVVQDVKGDAIPTQLSHLNWIFFREQDDFDASIQKLLTAIHTDYDWVKTHSRLQVKALEWERNRKEGSFLLRGKDLQEAEAQLVSNSSKQPDPTSLQLEYISTSRKASNRQRAILTSISIAGMIALALLAVFGFYQAGQATAQRNVAVTAQANAESARATAIANEEEAKRQAKISRAGQLSAESNAQRDRNFQQGLLLSVEAYKLIPNSQTFGAVMDNVQAHPQIRRFLNGSAKMTNSLALSPDGKLLAYPGLNNNEIMLWDMEKEQPFGQPLAGHTDFANSVSFSPDGKTLASASNDTTVILWDVASGGQIGEPFTGHTNYVTAVSFSPDGKMLASGDWDSLIIFWDAQTREELGRFTNSTEDGSANSINSLAFSPDGKMFASGDQNGWIALWNVETLQYIESLNGGPYYINSLAFSPDSKTLASTNQTDSELGTLMLWDVATRQSIPLKGHVNAVNSVAFSPDGTILASGGDDKSIILWDVATHQPIGEPFTLGSSIYSVIFSRDGKTLISNDTEGTIVFSDLTSHPLSGHSDYINSMAFSPDGKTIASGGDYTVRLWDVATRQPIGAPLEGHTEYVRSIAFSPDGKMLASSSNDTSIILWDVIDLNAPSKLTVLSGHDTTVRDLDFSPDGKILASGDLNGVIILWDVATQKAIGQPLTEQTDVTGLSFSPDGKALASGRDDGKITLWNISDPSSLAQIATLSGHSDQIRNMNFSPDGKTLASSSDDGSIILWDVATHEPIGQPLTAHTGAVFAVTFSPDGKMLASGSFDRTIILWDVATLQPLGQPLTGHLDSVGSLAFSPDSKLLASGSQDATIIFWDTDINSWVEKSCQRAGRNFTLDEWAQYFPNEAYRKTCE